MSIIAEALKRAEREKDKTISSKKNMDRIFGPERKGAYKVEERKDDKLEVQSERSKVLPVLGSLLVLTIVFLSLANIYLLPSLDVEVADSEIAATEVPLEAEAYSNLSSEVSAIESKTPFNEIGKSIERESLREQFLLNFTLNGIVYDVNDSWAIINNSIVRAGDTFEGARVVSIEPRKVVLLFGEERFDLVVK